VTPAETEARAWRAWALGRAPKPSRRPGGIEAAYRHLARAWKAHGKAWREHETLVRLSEVGRLQTDPLTHPKASAGTTQAGAADKGTR